uniref:Lung seven transmembrane receptor family protein n=1 Tax=Globodera pallida TaxID=36090 RepID=A0A183C6U7_GLOPA
MQFSRILLPLLAQLCLLNTAHSKIHTLFLTDDSRRNILLSKFGYGSNGTLEFSLANFTVPDAVLKQTQKDGGEDKLGIIGFTLSRGRELADGVRTNPHLCQLQQQDQGIDSLFFVFDFPSQLLLIVRSGHIKSIQLCTNLSSCPYSEDGESRNSTSLVTSAGGGGFLSNLFGGSSSSKNSKQPYLDFLPTVLQNGQYSTQFAVRFNEQQKGFYFLFFHNCFNYREHGYSDRVAVDLTVTLVERNVDSFLSIEDIPKPNLYIYFAFVFALATILWANLLCKADGKSIFKVHRLMLALVFLKSLTLLFHGVNFYFVSVYGHERELWAIIYYVTHLLKGALLFGTIILIGTGYTFFKRFLGDRDRRLFMFVLPLQILDNIAMIILEESEFGDKRYLFWLEMFTFLDLVCCMSILLPILWSIAFLAEGAAKTADGKAAFNLERLRLFRRFYLLVIAYIYTTRGAKFMLEYILTDEKRWISGAFVELASLFFFCLVGAKFRPQKSNPYLRLSQEDWAGAEDAEAGVAMTTNGLFEKVKRKQRLVSVQQEEHGDLTDRSTEDDDDNTLLPKTGRDLGLSSL